MAVGVPSRFVSAKLTVAVAVPGLLIAIPVWTEPADSAYMRNAELLGSAGTLASETRTPFDWKENTSSPEGATLPELGVTRTHPVCNIEPAPAVCSLSASRCDRIIENVRGIAIRQQ